mmetsp:Transcript_277/g.509  ORF Transcript_277/g.509 Transcript_277/m.509 type:complete len:256 (-) Transcript_277:233-1000(-)
MNYEEEYKCPLCLDLMVRPVSLTACGHAFCKYCLEQFSNMREHDDRQLLGNSSTPNLVEVRCPLCRTKNTLKENNKSLPVNKDMEEQILTLLPKLYKERLKEVELEVKENANKSRYPNYVIKLAVGNQYELMKTPRTSSRGLKENKNRWNCFVRAIDPHTHEDISKKHLNKVFFGLHPTFRPHKIWREKAPFEVKRIGWGTFDIDIKVYFKDQKKPVRLSHELIFDGHGQFLEYFVDLRTHRVFNFYEQLVAAAE